MILSEAEVQQAIELATTAPSVLNIQPWRFFRHDDVIDVFAVPSRGLPAVDPSGRETYVSCGAAVFNLRLAIAALGRTPVVRLLPIPGYPAHLASVRIAGPGSLEPDERPLFDAMTRRRTSREPFSDEPVPDPVRNALAAAADREGARLDFVPAWRRSDTIRAVHEADRVQRRTPRVIDEVDRWTLHREDSTIGIPASALGPQPGRSDALVRDFPLGCPVAGRETADFEDEPQLAVILTLGDDQWAWLRAGLALERVLLTATVLGLSTGLLTSPLEVPSLRNQLVVGGLADGHPQVLLRLGYGPTGRNPPAPPRVAT